MTAVTPGPASADVVTGTEDMMLAWIRCKIRNRHMPTRYFLGGFKCTECGALGADLDDMGFHGEGYLSTGR